MRITANRKANQDIGAEIPTFVHRTVSAHGQPAPATTAARSVFDAARVSGEAAKANARAATPRFDLAGVVIRKGVPKPEVARGAVAQYNALLARMEPGDSVELPMKQARGLYSAAKKLAKATDARTTFSFRKLTATHGGVWRDA